MRFRSLPRLLVAAALAVVCACSAHPHGGGSYAFTATEILQDSCGLLADPEALWDGRFIPAGERVWLEYDLFDTRLVGEYQEVAHTFIADGTSHEVTAEVGTQSCRLDYVSIHLEGTVESETAFSGEMSVRFQSNDSFDCRCDLGVRYRAQKVSD